MLGPTGAAEPCNALAKQDKRNPSPDLRHPQPAVSPCPAGVLHPQGDTCGRGGTSCAAWRGAGAGLCTMQRVSRLLGGQGQFGDGAVSGGAGGQRGWPWGHRGVPASSRAGPGQMSPGAAGVGAAGGGHTGGVCVCRGCVCAGGVPGHFSPCFGGARLLPSFVIPRLPPPVCVCVCARVLSPIVRDFFSTVWAGDRF